MVGAVTQDAINNLNANNAVGANAAKAVDDQQTLGQNFNTFLTLLTAQLQNQDPLSPMDSNQFTQQLVQFSQVEQQIQTNKKLDTLVSGQQANMSGTALAYLGRDAILQSDSTRLTNGVANWDYSLDNASTETTLSVKDAGGHIIYSTDGANESGDHLFSWDGRETNGNKAPDGVYTLLVTAKDSAGTPVTSKTTTRETILGVDFSSTTPQVITSSGSHDIDAVRAILNGT